ncbi:MAG TPA: hypothetical protein VFJ43_01990 [Bacteroidia bacterium]|nr:hypothetical protein [Bacteroidia bacterium]
MKKVIELFENDFVLTGDCADPRDLDFTFYAHEKLTSNSDGTPALKQYYMNYDSGTNAFSNLAVDCTYTYTLDGSGDVIKCVEDINWYFTDGTVGATRELVQVTA